ncbi:alpha-hydroxy acid oxidase [Ketogulonicigenium vulgare]|uniref:L-lactate dehydrogenase (Cytochrome) n=1 Tax=Ketogulonicigenium vulgare (strain WSH-001) TaxID=759362 RepID=F9Y9D0_KETVW|nr:alpha-hydroxy acid oxidase [Ketogulonicigenium vulgare]ADO41888.1 Lactate dehydrogenase [Ketogulonicigenium vulgare Y25]AEM40112.1 L-lactate dehydrogenase (cytochrome) [Ketogulonicigenium vulgare WSH-001]ALJ80317.1 alpha-hydroxy-acid oxidizing enzyme [Ketogulonicigenium vulgare]ANW33156.1 alpha-hydroxy-acid oxidizing enzyme [Ketogulonicigenium vulgare]AOZ53809.1 Lactate dehydrogenase [Ketogulonicigenium vulgare]
MTVMTTIEDLRRVYKRRAPKMFYDYTQSGSWTEQTFQDNTSDFADIRLRQRVAVDMSNRSLKTTMLGRDVSMPVALSPVGLTGMQSADGEIKAARAAAKFGVPYTLSTMSICSIEDVRAHSKEPFWFQLYVMRDEAFVDNIIQRAKNAGVSALVLTLDLQILGQRHKDLKNGLSTPPKPTLRTMADLALRWRWCAQMAKTQRRTFRNIVGHAPSVGNLSSLSSWTAEQFDPQLDWGKIARIREKWGGKLILKGILDAEDAVMAADAGADAIVVSNHGGRQLDGALSSIRILPSIVRAVGDRTEVWLDSGIRSGQDVLKALALGAKATMIGRSYIYGLGAYGEEGVTMALDIIRRELDVTMALVGKRDVRDLNRDVLLVPKNFEGDWA